MVRTNERPGERLRQLLARQGEPLCVLGIPTARMAQIMQRFGVEAGFVGTSLTFGNYTGLPDTGVASATECVAIARYVADAVTFPLLLDGDTGHGGPPAVRRLVHEAIRAGLAGLRLDDQPIESKRRTQSAGLQVVDRDAAVERYQAAVAARDEVDPSFVIMAQCYARDADNGGLDDALDRLALYETDGGVDWVQLEAPHSVAEVREARSRVKGVLSVMQGRMAAPLTVDEHRELGLEAAWYTFLPSRVINAACYEFMRDFQRSGLTPWLEFEESHRHSLKTLADW